MAHVTISESIRSKIAELAKELSVYRIAKDSRVGEKSLARFLEGGGMRSDHIDRLAEYLGAELVYPKKFKGK